MNNDFDGECLGNSIVDPDYLDFDIFSCRPVCIDIVVIPVCDLPHAGTDMLLRH